MKQRNTKEYRESKRQLVYFENPETKIKLIKAAEKNGNSVAREASQRIEASFGKQK